MAGGVRGAPATTAASAAAAAPAVRRAQRRARRHLDVDDRSEGVGRAERRRARRVVRLLPQRPVRSARPRAIVEHLDDERGPHARTRRPRRAVRRHQTQREAVATCAEHREPARGAAETVDGVDRRAVEVCGRAARRVLDLGADERDGAALGARVGVPQLNVDAKRRGAARRRRVERRVRHKVVEVRLRADEELEVRRADGAVLVGVELRQRPRREGRGDRRTPAAVGRQVRLRRRQVGDVEGAVAVDVTEGAPRRRAAGGARRRREREPPPTPLSAWHPARARQQSAPPRVAAVVEDEAQRRRRPSAGGGAVGATTSPSAARKCSPPRRRRRRPPADEQPVGAALARRARRLADDRHHKVVLVGGAFGELKVPARLSPALSTHAPAGAAPKSVGFELVGVSASRW